MNWKITIALISCTLMLSCHKDKKTTLSTDLTVCPATQDCSFLYLENSELSSSGAIKAGNFRLFQYQSVSANDCAVTTRLYFKVQPGATQFDIDASQINTDQVIYQQSCACCDFVAVQPVGGEIKGEKADATHWLVNARIALSSADKKFTSTLAFNQYFSVSSLVSE